MTGEKTSPSADVFQRFLTGLLNVLNFVKGQISRDSSQVLRCHIRML